MTSLGKDEGQGGARAEGTGLSSDDQARAGLGPSGFDPSRGWPLQPRHQRLPKWARLEIAKGLCAQINAEMAPDYRSAANRAFGGNCTFGDDDMAMLEHFASWAVDQGYRAGVADPATLSDMDEAQARRIRDSDGSSEAGETAQTGSTVGDSADPKGIAQTPSGEVK